MKDQTITLEAALNQVINALDRPTPLDEVVQRILAIRPSKAKNPVQQIRNNIRQVHRPLWVWLDQRTLLPMRLAMHGVRFRITPSQPEVERSLFYGAQNKPRYQYCERCKERGRKTIARTICINCSNRQRRNVLLCDDCADEEHMDHYLDEMLY